MSKLIAILGTPPSNGGNVDSVFGRTGVVVAENGDYTTDQVIEGNKKYFPEAPNDGKEYARKNEGWSEVVSSGLSNGFNVRFDDNTTPPPADGRMKFNNSDYSIVSEIYISYINQDDADMSNLIPVFIKEGSKLYIQDFEDASNYAYFDVVSDVVDTGSYFTVTVSHISSTGVLPTSPNSSTSVIIQSTVSSAIVEEVVAGANVEVNNVDPTSPIVSAFPTTTAGLLSRTYFTGDTETLGAGTFYKSNRDGKGTVATATQTVSVNDNQKAFFAQDLIAEPYPIDTTIFAGSYSGILNGLVSSNGGEQKFYVEIYKTDIDGVPVSSGVTGQPIGDLGVQVIATAESGLIDLRSGDETQFSITAELEENISLLTTNRVRYHVAAEKVGTTGGAIDVSTSYGTAHVSHLDIPVQALTNTVINTDVVEFPSSATQYDINRNIKLNVDSNTSAIGGLAVDIVTLDGDKISYSDNPSKTLTGGVRAFYDSPNDDLIISIDGTDIP